MRLPSRRSKTTRRCSSPRAPTSNPPKPTSRAPKPTSRACVRFATKSRLAEAAIAAAKADADRIQADIDDSSLNAPLDGRIQYRIAEPGEVLSSGGRVLNLVDLTDVYLTFFVPEETAGKIALGADARIVLDAASDIAIPATISYVASVAQFTPKTVETREEREKLMFRVKAKIDPALLKQYVEYVKTGIPGVAWVRLDDKEPWPDFLKTPKEKGTPISERITNANSADKPAETNGTAAK